MNAFPSYTSFDPIPVPAPTPAPARQRTVKGPSNSYDAARTTDENKNHWANADALSVNSANSPDVRQKLRNRSRYEAANNSYAKGLVCGRADVTVGTCPRLQLSFPERYADPDFERPTSPPAGLAREVELRWAEWCDRVGLADKLRVMDRAETRDGEAFAVLVNNPGLPEDGVQLDLKLVEADQVATPDFDVLDRDAVDGIKFDQAGNPVEYHVLRRHPGDQGWWGAASLVSDYDRVPASKVIHLFEPDRPGQARGVPALTPGLPLFGQLRRYTLASLGAAELAAMIAGVIESDYASPTVDEAPEIEAMDQIPFARNALLTLPAGQKAKAFEGANPAPSYREFKNEILTESGRTIGAPRNVSTGSSADYNYSSGRLDQIDYQRTIQARRDRLRRIVLDRVFRAWAREAVAIPGYLPGGLPPLSSWRPLWRFDGFGSIDPVKEATANEIALNSGQTTLERVCAERGDDWEEVLEQQAREAQKRKALGLPEPAGKSSAAVTGGDAVND